MHTSYYLNVLANRKQDKRIM